KSWSKKTAGALAAASRGESLARSGSCRAASMRVNRLHAQQSVLPTQAQGRRADPDEAARSRSAATALGLVLPIDSPPPRARRRWGVPISPNLLPIGLASAAPQEAQGQVRPRQRNRAGPRAERTLV